MRLIATRRMEPGTTPYGRLLLVSEFRRAG